MSAMKKAKRSAVACFAGVLALCVATSAQQGEEREERVIAPGVTYAHLARKTPAGEPWSIHVVEVSRAGKKLELRTARGAGADGEMQRERPTEMAQRAAAGGLNVVAVVNGDYDLAAPYLGISDGLSVTAGAITTTGKPAWPAMGVTSSGEPVIGVPRVEMVLESRGRSWRIAALNKPLGTTWGAGLHLYTREFRGTLQSEKAFRAVVIGKISRRLPLRVDTTVSGVVEEIFEGATQVPIPAGKLVLVGAQDADEARGGPKGRPYSASELRAGEKVKLRIRVEMNGQKKIRDAVGGFPILVEGGRKHIVGEVKASLAQRHPRTAVCFNERKVIFAVVDGRQPQLSVGMTLEELAELMVELGCATAMNTDGGGSSVMAVKKEVGGSKLEVGKNTTQAAGKQELQIVNSPSDGQERGRGNAWVVVRRE